MTSHFLSEDGGIVAVPEAFISLVAAVADIAIIVDRTGVIRDLIWKIERPAGFEPTSLIGDQLEDIVTEESRPKIAQMLEEGEIGVNTKWREVNHLIDGVGEFPMRYQAVAAGEAQIFLGHEMQTVAALQTRLVEAQRALDEDYGRLRQLETRYRVLFQTSSDALVIVDGDKHRIQEVNSTAAALLGRDADALIGQPFQGIFAAQERSEIEEAFSRVATSGDSEDFTAALDGDNGALECKLSIFRAAESTMILCTLDSAVQRVEGESAIDDMLVGMVGKIPDAMVLTDHEGTIRWCNDAFLGMSEVALAQQARGQELSRFIGRPGVDIDIIISNAREHGRLRAFTSVMIGAYGSETRVEISVAAIGDASPPSIGFVIRDITRFDQLPSRKTTPSSESVDDLMQLVGTVPLKELVRASTEEIEKMCIETALKKTGNNRASAAEILGLSRQSLYVKLRRFGLVESGR